jgi:hypothetical protein
MILIFHFFRSAKAMKKLSLVTIPFSVNSMAYLSDLCKMGICVFAFITGYGLLLSIKNRQMSKEQTLKWYISRLLKTMSGYYFIFILMAVVTQIVSGDVERIFFKKSIVHGIYYLLLIFLGLSNFFKTPYLRISWWYMSAAILFIILIPLIYRCSKKVGYLPILLLLIALPRLLNIGHFKGVNPYPFIMSVLMGMIFADYDLFVKIGEKLPKNIWTRLAVTWMTLGGLFIGWLFIFKKLDFKSNWQIAYSIFTIIMILFFKYCIIAIKGIDSILRLIGIHSMNIYLFQNFLRYGIFEKDLYSLKNVWLILMVVLVISLAFSIVIEQIKKWIRYEKLIDRIQLFLNNLVDGFCNEDV